MPHGIVYIPAARDQVLIDKFGARLVPTKATKTAAQAAVMPNTSLAPSWLMNVTKAEKTYSETPVVTTATTLSGILVTIQHRHNDQ